MAKKKSVDHSLIESIDDARTAFDDTYPIGDAGEPMGDSDYIWTAKAVRARNKIAAAFDMIQELAAELPELLKVAKNAGSPLRLLIRSGFDEDEAKKIIKQIKKGKCA